MINISNFVDCDIEKINDDDYDRSSLKDLETFIWQEIDGDEQKFVNVATILSSFYGDVSDNFVAKWSR